MNERLQPGFLRSVLRYTAFDLVSLPPRQILGLVGAPLVLFVPLAAFIGVMVWTGGDRQDVLLLYPEPAEHESLVTWVEALDDDIVARAAVSDPTAEERLASGELEMLVTVPVDLHGSGGIEIRRDRSLGGVKPRELRSSLRDWIAEREVSARAGPAAPLVVMRPDGTQAAEADTADPMSWLSDSEAGSTIRQFLGFFVVGLVGTMTGLMVGSKIVESATNGFNHVLGLGTPRRAVYASEMLTGAVMALIQSASWWAFYAVGFAGLAWSSGAEVVLPAWQKLAIDGAMMGALGVCALVQASAAGCFGALLIRDVEVSLRQAVTRVGFFAFFLVAMAFGSRASDTAWLVASGLPLVGPMALWSHFASTGQGAWLVAVHGIYAVAALDLGSRIFGMDESPLDWARRRLRAS